MIRATDSSIARRTVLLVSVAGAASATLGSVVLVGWYTHTVVLIQVLPAFVPMQYNTALGFLLCGIGLVALVHGRKRTAVALGSMAGAIGLLTLIQYVFGVQLGIDQLFFEHYITVETSHPGRMAPNTALSFSLIAAGLIVAARLKPPGQRLWIVGGLGVVVLSLGSIAFFGYATGAPTAYGWGQLTRMAVHTSAGFLSLSLGLLFLAYRDSAAWAAGSNAFITDKVVHEQRKIVSATVGIMALVSMAVGLTILRESYSTALDAQRDRLAELVQGRIWMIEAMARFDEQYRRAAPGDPRAATLSQVVEGQERYPGFGRTGEFTFARREGDEIIFIVRPPHAGPDFVERLGIGSARAEPLRRALDGDVGTLIGVDYRGERVVAAYAPAAQLDLGVVAKMDLAEVREPFVRSAFLTAAIALVIIAIGAGATMVSIGPLARRVGTQAMDLHLANVELMREADELEELVRALRERESLLEGIYHTYPDMQFILEPDGTIVRYSAAGESDLYVRPEMFLGKRMQDVLPPDGAHLWEDALREPGDGVRSFEYSLPISGEDREYEGRVSVLPDGRFIAIARDITERKRAEAQHREHQRLGRIFEDSLNEIYLFDSGTLGFSQVNRGAQLNLGYTMEELRALTPLDLKPEFTAESFAELTAPLRRGEKEKIVFETVHKRKDQTLYDVEVHLQLRGDEHEEMFTAIILDITQRKRAEKELHEMNVGLERRVEERTEQLVAANQELESFAYSVSHDLKAPLRAIDGYSGMLEESHGSSLPEDGLRLLGVVRNSARQMARLIDDLLAFSRIGRVEMAISDVDMGALAQAVFSELSSLEGDRTVEFSVGELPTVPADLALIRQVWTNLLQNALKFTGGREVARVEIDHEEEPDHWVFRVRDNGAGFDMAYVDKLFGVFQRLHHEEEFPGTGVGLATVQRIVHRHGGEVWAEGEVGAGATIFFRLPRGVGV